jgi:hypothetical protein
MPTMKSYTCPCCNRAFWRQDYAKRHLQKNLNLVAILIIQDETNTQYVVFIEQNNKVHENCTWDELIRFYDVPRLKTCSTIIEIGEANI